MYKQECTWAMENVGNKKQEPDSVNWIAFSSISWQQQSEVYWNCIDWTTDQTECVSFYRCQLWMGRLSSQWNKAKWVCATCNYRNSKHIKYSSNLWTTSNNFRLTWSLNLRIIWEDIEQTMQFHFFNSNALRWIPLIWNSWPLTSLSFVNGILIIHVLYTLLCMLMKRTAALPRKNWVCLWIRGWMWSSNVHLQPRKQNVS